jgi:hypothetical protein
MRIAIYSHWRSHKETTKFGGYTFWNVCYQLQVRFNLSFVLSFFGGERFLFKGMLSCLITQGENYKV